MTAALRSMSSSGRSKASAGPALSDEIGKRRRMNLHRLSVSVGVVVCILMTLWVSSMSSIGSSDVSVALSVPKRVLLVYAIAGIASVVGFNMVIGVRKIVQKPILILPLVAPLLIFMNELVRTRDWNRDSKRDQFASFRASVLVSAALASAASLPKETAKLVVSVCMVIAAAVLPLSSASEDSVSGTIAEGVQRSLMISLVWIIVGVIVDHYRPTPVAQPAPSAKVSSETGD